MAKYLMPLQMVMVGLSVLCLVNAWHPEKKVVKWSPTYFRPAAVQHMCGGFGSPCDRTAQRHYGLYWRSTSCCFGLECADAGHGSFCSEPLDESVESLEEDENSLDPDLTIESSQLE